MIPRPPSPCPGPARLAGAVATLLLAGLAACDAAPTAVPAVPAPSLAAGAIVNGETETGWVGVGALTTVRGTRYGGAYCTAELVAPQWVLTAGHCVAGEDLSDQGITPASTRFFIGADARGGGGGSEPDGDFYQADAFVPHPGYDPRGNSSSHDIGLVHLATPVAGEVPIYGLMEGNLQTYAAANGPLDVFTVGYGATEGIRSSGSGLKRSTHVALSSFGPGYYTSLFDGTGTCFGDSGGPGFITLEGGVPVIIGVTSAGAGCLPGDSDCDPCQTETYVTRVDSHLAWIQDIIAGGFPTCDVAPSVCKCAEACLDDGACDDTVCHADTCGVAYQCLGGCDDDACRAACVDAAAEDARGLLDQLLACADAKCSETTSSQQLRQCVRTNCPFEMSACDGSGPTTPGVLSCDQIYDCAGACTTASCQDDCVGEGTADAQAALSVLSRCLRQQCRNLSGDEYSACAHEKCETELNGCYVPGPLSCDEVRGCVSRCGEADTACPSQCWQLGTVAARDGWEALRDCEKAACAGLTGEALDACAESSCVGEALACSPGRPIHAGCAVTGGDCPAGTACVGSGEATSCVASAGKGEGDACDEAAATAECGDGLACAAGICAPACVDADADGVCAPADCDDAAASAHPGAPEVCGDGVDNDCDGVVDGGCPVAPVEETAGEKASSGCAGGGDAGASGLLALLALALLAAWLRRAQGA